MRVIENKIPPVALAFLLGALMWVAARTIPAFGFTLPAGPVLGAGLALAGVVIALLGVVSFRRARTTVNPLHPEAASALVTSGIYRLTRNPMYLGLLLVLLGGAMYLANAAAFIVPATYVPLMNRLQIFPEERTLAALFGPAFADYASKVRRWL